MTRPITFKGTVPLQNVPSPSQAPVVGTQSKIRMHTGSGSSEQGMIIGGVA